MENWIVIVALIIIVGACICEGVSQIGSYITRRKAKHMEITTPDSVEEEQSLHLKNSLKAMEQCSTESERISMGVYCAREAYLRKSLEDFTKIVSVCVNINYHLGGRVTDQGHKNTTLLHECIKDGAYDFAKVLIEHDADPSIGISRSWELTKYEAMHATPLHSAVQDERIELVKLLLEAGADHSAVDGDGYTPLCVAVRNDKIAIARTLLAGGANPSQVHDTVKCPLLCANSAAMAKLLVYKGADVNAPVQRLGYFADGYSGGEGHDLADVVYGADRIELLVKNGASAKEKHIHCLFQEGENGAFIAGNYFDLIKPRHFAQLNNRHGSSSIIDELALSGFNFNAQDRNGDTALAFVRDIQNVKRLVDAGASLTIPNVSGETFLDHCNGDFVHRNSSHEGVKIMKDLGIDLNAKDAFSKNTALHRLMILGNNVAAISDLLDAGADPTVRNGENKLPTEMGFPGADRREALMLMESVISKKNLLNELGETCQQPIMRRKM